jgi:biopolymer transport protein ExbD
MKILLSTILLVFSSLTLFAQQAELLTELPETKEDFIASEKKVIASIDWLENTPLNEDKEKHQQLFTLLTAWAINSPTVTIEVNANIIKFSDKNSELLIFYMAGWTKYALQNNYSKDVLQGNLAGLRSAIKVFKTGALKKDKFMQKLVDIEAKGELEKWVTEQLAKK